MAQPLRQPEVYNPYAPQYPTIAGDFNERQYTRGGIQNVEAEMSTREGDRSKRRVTRSQRRQAQLVQQMEVAEIAAVQEQYALQQEQAAADEKQLQHAPHPRKETPLETDVMISVAKKAAARVSVAMAIGWTGFLNLIAFPVGVVALIALGATTLLDAIPGSGVVESAIGWFMGLDNFDIWVFAFALLGFYWCLIFTIFFGAYVQFKLSGIEPIHGRATGLKTAALIGALVICIIPGTTFFPWWWLWHIFVGLYPN